MRFNNYIQQVKFVDIQNKKTEKSFFYFTVDFKNRIWYYKQALNSLVGIEQTNCKKRVKK